MNNQFLSNNVKAIGESNSFEKSKGFKELNRVNNTAGTMLKLSKPQRPIVKLLMTPHHLPLSHFFLEPQGSSSGEPSLSVSLYQLSLICGALNIMLNYEHCWGIFVPIGLLNNPQPPSRTTGGSYGLKTFQIAIKKIFKGSMGPEAK